MENSFEWRNKICCIIEGYSEVVFNLLFGTGFHVLSSQEHFDSNDSSFSNGKKKIIIDFSTSHMKKIPNQ